MAELLVVQNEAGEGLGGLERGLRAAGLDLRIVHAYAGDEVPASVGACPGLVVLGGSPHVHDDASGPWMPAVARLLRSAHAGRVPILGVCLGAQLAAHALGGRVARAPAPEAGFAPIRLTEDARDDPLLGHLDGARVFHLHEDAYARPPGAALLASSEACEEQAFRLGRTTYGLQFHPEADADLVARMAGDAPEAGAWVREAKARADELARVADGVAAGFARLVAGKLLL